MKYYPNIKSLSAYFGGVPQHPLIDIQSFDSNKFEKAKKSNPAAYDFYKISFIKNAAYFCAPDAHGAVFFTAPGEKYTCSSDVALQGFQLLIDANIYRSHLAEKNINAYTFFSQDRDKPLFLAKDEAQTTWFLLERARQELERRSDKFTVSIVLSYISILLNTCQRIADHEFESQHATYNQLTSELIKQLRLYYADESGERDKNKVLSLPSVAYFAKELNVTPNHLSDVVRQSKGTSALQIIHEHIIEEAKLLLLSTDKSVSEISFHLGFAYPSYFSRLFKKKTHVSPTQFRKSVKSI